jgi:hypothetical protein
MAVNAVGSAGVAGEHPHRDRASGGVGQQPVLDLGQALLTVAGVAAGRQRTVFARHPGEGQVEQGEPVGVGWPGKVGSDELGLGPVLAGPQPVHRRVDLLGGRVGHAEVVGQGGTGPPTGRGQLRGRPAHPGDDQGQRDVSLPPGWAEQPGKAQRFGLGVDCGDVPVRA